MSLNLDFYQYQGESQIRMADRANLWAKPCAVKAVSPSQLIDDSLLTVVDFEKTNITLPLSDQLYTARGSQAVGTSNAITDDLIAGDLSNYKQTMLMKNYNFGYYDTYYQRRVLWTTEGIPDYLMSESSVNLDGYAFVNFPTLL